ncbi:hypothetical protein [Paracidovorax anthurii]|uniref:Uncharacterized protein n=1 Tax=Paracidovorax anthurii TaxID=78229 RepID=A0A328ZMW2_9BURK|nr:hypothetical protein [Paracidovorax anthurii]RAR86062.1 hypothetical protein AX018_100223 [Paracidovorax anthurii]
MAAAKKTPPPAQPPVADDAAPPPEHVAQDDGAQALASQASTPSLETPQAAPADAERDGADEAPATQPEHVAQDDGAQALAPQASTPSLETPQASPADAERDGADEAPATQPVTRTYLVSAVPIRHDGRSYDVGYDIELTDAQAQRLGGLVIPIPEGATTHAD